MNKNFVGDTGEGSSPKDGDSKVRAWQLTLSKGISGIIGSQTLHQPTKHNAIFFVSFFFLPILDTKTFHDNVCTHRNSYFLPGHGTALQTVLQR